jgi:hypothetical protein
VHVSSYSLSSTPADVLLRARAQHNGVQPLCSAIFDVRHCVCRPEVGAFRFGHHGAFRASLRLAPWQHAAWPVLAMFRRTAQCFSGGGASLHPQATYAMAAQHPWLLPSTPRRLPKRAARLLPLLQRMMGAPSDHAHLTLHSVHCMPDHRCAAPTQAAVCSFLHLNRLAGCSAWAAEGPWRVSI